MENIGNKFGYELTFYDEFNGKTLDTKKWSFTNYMNGYSDLIVKNTSDVAAVTTDSDANGVLRLTASKYATGKYKTTQSITTGKKMTFQYGYLEIRAKVPTGLGVWPSLWLKSQTTSDDALAARLGYNTDSVYETEVDVFEVFGSNNIVPNLHKWWKTEEQINKYGNLHVQSGTKHTYTISDNDWHTYGMLWTPYEISMFVDGHCYMTYNLGENFGTGLSKEVGMVDFHNPLCIIFNNHLFTPGYTATNDGAWAANYTVTDDFTKAVYDIDYVRLYQKQGQSKIFFAD